LYQEQAVRRTVNNGIPRVSKVHSKMSNTGCQFCKSHATTLSNHWDSKIATNSSLKKEMCTRGWPHKYHMVSSVSALLSCDRRRPLHRSAETFAVVSAKHFHPSFPPYYDSSLLSPPIEHKNAHPTADLALERDPWHCLPIDTPKYGERAYFPCRRRRRPSFSSSETKGQQQRPVPPYHRGPPVPDRVPHRRDRLAVPWSRRCALPPPCRPVGW
jgi:hypothetical protein